jgi:hypothetical protein
VAAQALEESTSEVETLLSGYTVVIVIGTGGNDDQMHGTIRSVGATAVAPTSIRAAGYMLGRREHLSERVEPLGPVLFQLAGCVPIA